MTVKELLQKTSLAKSQQVRLWLMDEEGTLPQQEMIPAARLSAAVKDAAFAPEMAAEVLDVSAFAGGLSITARRARP